VWFRDDLRLADQPALAAAVASGAPVLCVFVFDEESPRLRHLGGAARWWLHHSLKAHAAALRHIGGRLDIVRGPGAKTIEAVAKAAGASRVDWTRRYAAAEIAVDMDAKERLKHLGIEAASHNGQLLFEPWTLKTNGGGFYRVFSPFWRAALAAPTPAEPAPAPRKIARAPWPSGAPTRVELYDLALLPRQPDWAGGLRDTWTPGEAGARERFESFLDDKLGGYAAGRERPGVEGSSRLSPHLRFGEISPRAVFHAAGHARSAGHKLAADATKFLAEIGWREFCHHLLFHAPDIAARSFQPRFDAFEWREPGRDLRAWQTGRTGYPYVDAGMRQLWRTGWMHNRVRMACASFLTKHLLIDWRVGERWFWDTLCDADPANNPANWQWVAGSGADAAPYYRVFNPVLQGEKFDPDGDYVRAFVPELAGLSNAHIHKPWLAPYELARHAKVELGRNYPLPIVDHAAARARALEAFRALPPARGRG
jgi:deoxyribodipyrimidine photo-lyase